MSLLKHDHLVRFGIIAIAFFVSLLMTAPPAISQPCAVPPASGGTMVLPNVLVIFDNSGSMREDAHQGNYSPATTYAGIFDSDKRYTYDTTNDYFYEDDPGGDWSGNFLNWISMLKVDVARQVLTGGKVYNDGTNNYLVSNTAENSTPNRAYTDDSSPYQTDHHGTYYYTHWGYADTECSAFDVSGGGSTWTYYIKLLLPAGYVPQGLLHTIQDRVRLGLMHFNSSEGGYIRRYIHKLDSTQLNDIVSDLNRDLGDDYSGSYTPLAETLYEATRFFSQVSPYYNGGDYTTNVGDVNDPFYNEDYEEVVWCASNYVILLTDGNSTQDRNIPAALQDYYDDDITGCVPDPDPCGCDPDYDCSGGGFTSNGSAYLDDIAYYAHTTDLRPADGGARALRDDQTITLHTVYIFGAAGVADILLDKAAQRGGGIYKRAENASEIVSALEDIFQDITEGAAAAASVAITSETVSGADLVYIPYFKHPGDNEWWGNIRAFELDNDGNLIDNTGVVALDNAPEDGILDRPIWDVAVELQGMDPDNRNIFSYIPGTGKVDFETSSGTLDQYFDVDLNGDSTEDDPTEADALISYIRGTDNPGGFTLRGRDSNYLGDIIHASPAFVGKPSARYDLLYGDIDYWDFYWTNYDRRQVLYAGANDGMLHCFDATIGQELWAYIPYNLLSHLKWLADPNYCHGYYVDLSPTVRDIKVGTAWKSVLIGGMRLGGTPDGVDSVPPETLRSAFFALDVTDPDNVSTDPNAVLWEISDDSFGYTTSNPIPVKVGNTWYLVFGSGPKTRDGEGDPTAGGGDGYTDNYAHIFVVNASNGDILRTINIGALGEDNFFGPPVAIDYDLDYSVDAIYIGDAKGNLWRIKTFTGSGASKTYAGDQNGWIIDVGGNASATDPEPLLSLGTDQPITIKPTVSKDANGRVWIYFGTGRYFCANDNTYCGEGNECPTSGDCIESESVGDRSKYMAVGVYDRHWDSTAGAYVLQNNTIDADPDPSTVLDHRVIKQGTVVGSPSDYGYYIVDADTGQAATDVSTGANGWYFHLLDPKERCLGDFTIYRGAVFFLSFTPDDTDPCARGGLSSLYGVYYTSGTSTTLALFDLTGDRNIDSDDLVTDGADLFGPAVKKLDEGFPGGSLKIDENEGITPLPKEPIDLNPPGDEGSTGVTSWREVLP